MSLESLLERSKDIFKLAKKQADMNLTMFGHDDTDRVMYAQGVADGIESAMKEVEVEPFDTEMRVRIIYSSNGNPQHVYLAKLVQKLPFKLAKGDPINIEGDAFTAGLFVNSAIVKLHSRQINVVFDRLVVSIPASVAEHEQQMASLAALGWMVRKVSVQDAYKYPW